MVFVVYPAERAEDGLHGYVFHWRPSSPKGREWRWRQYTWDLYTRVRMSALPILHELGRYNVLTHVDSSFLQMFLWECIGFLTPRQSSSLLQCPARLEECLTRGGRRIYTSLVRHVYIVQSHRQGRELQLSALCLHIIGDLQGPDVRGDKLGNSLSFSEG